MVDVFYNQTKVIVDDVSANTAQIQIPGVGKRRVPHSALTDAAGKPIPLGYLRRLNETEAQANAEFKRAMVSSFPGHRCNKGKSTTWI